MYYINKLLCNFDISTLRYNRKEISSFEYFHFDSTLNATFNNYFLKIQINTQKTLN